MGKILKNTDYQSQIDLKTKVEFEDRASFFDEDSSVVVSKEVLDSQTRARGILEEARLEAIKIRKEAKEVLQQVHEEMERSKKKGEEVGYQEGLERALRYLHEIHLLREKMFENLEPQVVKLVFTIAEKVIGDQVRQNDQAIISIVRQALAAAIGNKITIRLNPEDFIKVKENEPALLSKLESSKTVFFKEDETVATGGCMVESEVGAIDAQLQTQLGAIKKALGL